MNPIDIVLVTWPNHPKRLAYFCRMLTALRTHLSASRHPLYWHCSSESERDPASSWHGEELREICRQEDIALHWHEGPASLGAGMNAALRACSSDLIFLVQDDYELLRPLDLSPGADVLMGNERIDLIRYSYPPKEYGIRFYSCEWPGFQAVYTTASWPYGDDPHLRHRRMMDRHGWYTEGIGHASEGDMVTRLARNRAGILASERCYFGHFGSVSAVPANQDNRERAPEGKR